MFISSTDAMELHFANPTYSRWRSLFKTPFHLLLVYYFCGFVLNVALASVGCEGTAYLCKGFCAIFHKSSP